MVVDVETMRECVRKEILRTLREDPEVRCAVWLIVHSEFTDTDDAQMHQQVTQALGIAAHNDTEDVRP